MADKKISALTPATTPLAGTEELPIVQSGATKKVSVDNLTAGKAVSASSLTATNLKTSPATANLDISGTTIAAAGSDANVGLNITPKGTGRTTVTQLTTTSPEVLTSINDTNGNELFGVTATGSAVNEFTVANAATTNSPTISATGSDTNIGIRLAPKGTGDVTVVTGNLVIGTSGNGIDFSATAGTGTSELFDDYEKGTFTPALFINGDTFTFGTRTGYYIKIGDFVYIWGSVQWTAVTNNFPVRGVYLDSLPYAINSTAPQGAFLFASSGITIPASTVAGGWTTEAVSPNLITPIFTKTDGTGFDYILRSTLANAGVIQFGVTYSI
jgi:hypothetical protein